ncbi:hypothetical protein C8R45DRAFT_1171393 [Mycena sanguinolenta]|nr:hypothetical protein C8R45DRAFT_1171393 [Mycena sanguinolenta]
MIMSLSEEEELSAVMNSLPSGYSALHGERRSDGGGEQRRQAGDEAMAACELGVARDKDEESEGGRQWARWAQRGINAGGVGCGADRAPSSTRAAPERIHGRRPYASARTSCVCASARRGGGRLRGVGVPPPVPPLVPPPFDAADSNSQMLSEF